MRDDNWPITTWRQMFVDVLRITGDSLDDLTLTLTDAELDVEFDCSYGGAEGKPFTAWSERYVYFPASYDGSEWIAFVSRHPDGKPTEHIGT